MINLENAITHKLIYNNEIVGVQLIFKDKLYDTDLDTLKLINEDFDLYYLPHPQRVPDFMNSLSSLILVDRGRQLVHQNSAYEVDGLTYDMVAEAMGYSHLVGQDLELKAMFNEYNAQYFNNTVPKQVKIGFSSRMGTTVAGRCFITQLVVGAPYSNTRYTKYEIKLSVKFFNRDNLAPCDSLKNVIIHEMVHVLLPGEHHGPVFKREMNRLNAQFPELDITVYTHTKPEPKQYKRLYVCKQCGKQYPRQRRLDMSKGYMCGRCRGKLVEKPIEEYNPDGDYTFNEQDNNSYINKNNSNRAENIKILQDVTKKGLDMLDDLCKTSFKNEYPDGDLTVHLDSNLIKTEKDDFYTLTFTFLPMYSITEMRVKVTPYIDDNNQSLRIRMTTYYVDNNGDGNEKEVKKRIAGYPYKDIVEINRKIKQNFMIEVDNYFDILP